MENHQSSYYSISYGPTALKICHYTVHQKLGEQYIWEKSFKFNSFAVLSAMENPQSSYYSDSYGDTAVKISHDTVHQKVSKQHIWQ